VFCLDAHSDDQENSGLNHEGARGTSTSGCIRANGDAVSPLCMVSSECILSKAIFSCGESVVGSITEAGAHAAVAAVGAALCGTVRYPCESIFSSRVRFSSR